MIPAAKSESHIESPLRRPSLSLVVVVYNMPREAPRTLFSLSADYQRHIDPDDYEVIVVDNGSAVPVDPASIDGLAGDFRVIRIDPGRLSPAYAVNRGLKAARGEIVGVMIDGARIATPGLLHFAQQGARLYDEAVVATLGWYLGHDLQGWAQRYGYDSAREDALLESIGWPHDGYRLFEIGTMDESSVDGWFQPISESNAVFSRRRTWESLGGLDERFDAPGGGLVNLDTFSRLLERPDAQLVILLGEGTFHQIHGGISTNASPERQVEKFQQWSAEYEAIRGRPYQLPSPSRRPTYVGTLPRPALARLVRAAVYPIRRHFERPLGSDFDSELWSGPLPARPADETIAGLLELARDEFRCGRFEASCAVARLALERAPDQPGLERMLSLVAPSVQGSPPAPQGADYHLALAGAHRMLGESALAAVNYRAALTFNRDLPQAHLGLAVLRLPGEDYLVWLDRLYRLLSPETVIEIGAEESLSLALLQSPTIAICVNANPLVLAPLTAEAHIFPETSDEFFARRGAERVLSGRPLSVAFVDGMCLYEQALKNVIGLEPLCGPRSVLIMRGTIPLDEPTQRRTRETVFHTGDVWKAVLALKECRPDLEIFTIATPPSGLTVVTGLDPSSRVLADRYAEVVARFRDLSFSESEPVMAAALNVVPNDWTAVRSRLEERRT